jgi:uncharacterized membrane protein YqjE
METEEPAESLRGSSRRIAETVLRIIQNRAELFGLEIEEEGRWVVAALIWTAATIFFAVLAITIVTVTLVMLLPAEARPWCLVGFSVIYLALATAACLKTRKLLRTRRSPMSDTVNELRKDLEWIQSRE